jgi:hypothetical protein
MNTVPMFMNVNYFGKMTIGTFAENYRHPIVGKPFVAVNMACSKVPNELYTLQQARFKH